jgi:hypothetical protein
MYERAKYKDSGKLDYRDIPDPVATLKRDGAHFFLQIDNEGNQRYYSRRPSVKGGHPERSAQIPHLSEKKLPQFAGQVFSVELIHTGHLKETPESHTAASGILNSLPLRAIQTQKDTGPIRAALIDVIEPKLPTYKDKLIHMKTLEKHFGNPDLMFVDDPAIGVKNIDKLIDFTKRQQREGVIVASLTRPEHDNPRAKIKHFYTFNLRVNRVIQEFDKNGHPKDSMGALELTDSTGRVVGMVGTGFSRALRQEIWRNPKEWIGRLIQVKTMGLSIEGGRLRAPVFNGDADGEMDKVEYGVYDRLHVR